jgi:hypothetical protein
MFTTAGARASATWAKELDSSAGEGGASGLASRATGELLAARTPWETTVPIKIPIPSVTTITTAGKNLRPLVLIQLPLSTPAPFFRRHIHYSITVPPNSLVVLTKLVALW